MSTTELENQKRKIKALIEKSDSAEKIGNLEEAEAFATKASELLMKYNLEKADVLAHSNEKLAITDVTFTFEELGWRKVEAGFVIKLMSTLSYFNQCRLVVNKYNGWLMVFGDEQNIEVVKFMFDQLRDRLRTMARVSYKANQYQTHEKKNTYTRGFLEGACAGIGNQLQESRDTMEAENNQVTGLIRLTGQLVDQTVAAKFPKLGKTRRSTLSGKSGSEQGYKQGSKISINKGVGGQSKPFKTT